MEIEAAGFMTIVTTSEHVRLSLSPNDFVDLALSSSHAAAVIEAIGRAGAEALLRKKSEELLDTDGSSATVSVSSRQIAQSAEAHDVISLEPMGRSYSAGAVVLA